MGLFEFTVTWHMAWHGIKGVLGGRWAEQELASYIPLALPDTYHPCLGIVCMGSGRICFGLQGRFHLQGGDRTEEGWAPGVTVATHTYIPRMCIWEVVTYAFLVLRHPSLAAVMEIQSLERILSTWWLSVSGAIMMSPGRVVHRFSHFSLLEAWPL